MLDRETQKKSQEKSIRVSVELMGTKFKREGGIEIF